MITPDEIKNKVLRIWDSGHFLRAWCAGEKIFPIELPSATAKGSYLSDNYSEVSRWITDLIYSSKEKRGFGYSIDFRIVTHRQLGRQKIPDRIFIESEDDFIKLCGKENEFTTFQTLFKYTENILPSLRNYVINNPLTVLKYKHVWNKLLNVCLYFYHNAEPRIYIRQLVIPGISTKFIESYKKIISELMTFIAPEKYKSPLQGSQYHSFEKQFFLLYDEPLIRFRILDSKHYISYLSDLALPLSQFNSLALPVKKIFITENKINGLSFPECPESIVIFGLGYGINILKEIPWLKNEDIYYWGDIDTHGFSILSMARKILPQCISFLMDEKILLAHRDSWSQESEDKRFTGNLSELNEKENNLFDKLKCNTLGLNIRLEQELIKYNFLLEFLKGVE